MSQSRNPRAARVSQAIRQGLSSLIAAEVSDPRVEAAGLVSVTHVDLNSDMSVATVYVSFVGTTDARAKAATVALDKAAGYLRGPLGRHLGMARAPALRFRHDQSAEFQAKVREIVLDDQAKAVDDDESEGQ